MADTSLVFNILAKDKTDKVFAKLGKKAALGFAAIGAAAVTFGVSAVKAAAEDQASQSKLAQTLKKTTGAKKKDVAGVEKWIDATSRASGVADDELRPAMSKLLVSGESVAQSQKDVALAMDVAAATGKPLASVAQALARAHNGNTQALGRLGVKTKDASGKALTYKQIQQNLAKQMGGASATAAGTFQGKMNRLKVAFHEAQETIGSKLLPVLTKLIGWVLDKAIPALGRFWAWFQKKILPTLKELAGNVIAGVRQGLKSIGDAIERNRPQLEKLWEGFKKVADFLITKVAPIWGKYLKAEFHYIGVGIGLVIDWIGLLIKTAPVIINNFVRPVVGAFLTFASMIVTAAATAFGWIPGLGGKLKEAKKAIDKFKRDADAAMGRLAYSMGTKGEAAGSALTKGFIRGISKNTGLKGPAAEALARQVAHQSGGIPAMAAGGVVTSPTLALIGEAGPEAVVPLSKMGGMGGGESTVRLIITGEGVLSGLRKEIRTKGGDVQVVLGTG